MTSKRMRQIINGKQYDTETAAELCGDDWWDGNNYERGGTQQFLFRTKKGAYFFSAPDSVAGLLR